MRKLITVSTLLLSCLTATSGIAAPAQIIVDAADVRGACSPWLYGACIEDVNHEIYGGLYDQRLYGESFEEPAPAKEIANWNVYGGQWSPFETGVAVAANRGARLERAQLPFQDGECEFDLHFTSPPEGDANAGMVFRVQRSGVGADAFDGYEVSLAADGRKIILGRHQQNFVPLQSAPVPVGPFDFLKWQKVGVWLEGGHIRVYLSGSDLPLIDYTDPNPLPAGGVGLRTWGANAEFQNIKVATGEREHSLEFVGEPKDAISALWDRVQSGSATGSFSLDSAQPFNGLRSQRIDHTGGAGTVGVANRGLNRWGIAVQRGHRYSGRVYLRATSLKGPVSVSLQNLDGSKTYARTTFSEIPAEWKKFSFELASSADDPNARFVVSLDSPGTIWIDQAVLMAAPEDRFHGLPVRTDIADTMLKGNLTFLRYGGTAVNAPGYRWRKMLGDPDKRPFYQGNWHPYTSNGFGIEEFVAFCEKAKITPAFAINAEETPQDMADMVEYLNGAETTPQGKLRAVNGHPKPYGVKYIEIGNEEVIWGDNAADYDHYVERFRLLSEAMKRVDPSLVFINAAWWRGDNPNCERVFKALEGLAAYWDFHFWADDADSGRKTDRELTETKQLFQKWVPGARMKVVIFEENGNLHNLQRALGHATTLNAVRRHGDFVAIDCEANGLQPWKQNDNGWDQGHIFFTPDKAWGMPPYYAQQMASMNHLPTLVGSRVIDGANLDVTATRSEDGKILCLHVINLASTASTTNLKVSDFAGIDAEAEAWTLSGGSNDVNTPERPTAVQPAYRKISDASGDFSYNFPAHSYTVLRLTRSREPMHAGPNAGGSGGR